MQKKNKKLNIENIFKMHYKNKFCDTDKFHT